MPETPRIVITGAPGTGKSTLLNIIEKQGFIVHPEMARQVIKEESLKCSDCVPWQDHSSFGMVLFGRQREQYLAALEGKINFYDRVIPDNLGYLRRDTLQNKKLEAEALKYPYHHQIFLTPPWKEIYMQDAERWEDFELMLEIHDALVDIYTFFGYDIIEVPKSDPQTRVDFIWNNLNLREVHP